MGKVFRVGLEMELEGLRVYEAAAANSNHAFAKQMFRGLANDEKRHAAWFRKLAEERGVAPADVSAVDPDGFLKTIRAIFSELREQIEGAGAETDDIQAIDLALGLEDKAYTMYHEASEAADNADEKAVLELIAREENNHYAILADTRLYLTDPEKWNIKEEGPLIDGG